jgi:hypothetical protein
MAGGVGEGCEARKRAAKESKGRSTKNLKGRGVVCRHNRLSHGSGWVDGIAQLD